VRLGLSWGSGWESGGRAVRAARAGRDFTASPGGVVRRGLTAVAHGAAAAGQWKAKSPQTWVCGLFAYNKFLVGRAGFEPATNGLKVRKF